jgi:deoxyribodipyrimidine photo-lyase
VLHAFLHERSGQYRGGISSPLSAPSACSRLSPISRWAALACAKWFRPPVGSWPTSPEADRRRAGLTAFISRLHWHCHFIQKLESEPELEFRNLHRGYDGLRPAPRSDWNPAHLDALVSGRTGWPLVDACVAMLRDTGWLNFRMRAMLVSVASYPVAALAPGGRMAGPRLHRLRARHPLEPDADAGRHHRHQHHPVYNPIKQARDHDPKGRFVRRWLPALARVPDAWLFEPWRMPPDIQARCGVRVGVDIPLPLVELETATREAKARVHALRAQPEVRAAKAAIVAKHGSRRRPDAPARQAPPAAQLALDL